MFTTDGTTIESLVMTATGEGWLDSGVGEFAIAKVVGVPEPSSLALLALGTLGLGAWRRKL